MEMNYDEIITVPKVKAAYIAVKAWMIDEQIPEANVVEIARKFKEFDSFNLALAIQYMVHTHPDLFTQAYLIVESNGTIVGRYNSMEEITKLDAEQHPTADIHVVIVRK